jgi:hypothetical protein
MDLLLRLLERRVLIGIAVAAAALAAGEYALPYALDRLDAWRHPPPPAVSPLAADLVADNERRESARLRGLHRVVSAELAAARARGHDVDKLQRAADSALALDEAAYRGAAMERLNRLRLAVPVGGPQVRPADPDLDAPDSVGETVPRARRRR